MWILHSMSIKAIWEVTERLFTTGTGLELDAVYIIFLKLPELKFLACHIGKKIILNIDLCLIFLWIMSTYIKHTNIDSVFCSDRYKSQNNVCILKHRLFIFLGQLVNAKIAFSIISGIIRQHYPQLLMSLAEIKCDPFHGQNQKWT